MPKFSLWQVLGGIVIFSIAMAFASQSLRSSATSVSLGTKVTSSLLLASVTFLLTASGTYFGWVSYRVVLPGVWFIASLVSWNHPGDEYGLFAIGILPAGWIAPLLNYTHLREVVPHLLAAGVVTMGFLGWLMDRARIWWSVLIPLVLVVATALIWYALASYPSYQRSMAKNGSLAAYITCATNVSLYLSTAAVLMIVGLVRAGRAIRRWVRPAAGRSSTKEPSG